MDLEQSIRNTRDNLNRLLRNLYLDPGSAFPEEYAAGQPLNPTDLHRWAVGEILKIMRAPLADARRQMEEGRPLAATGTLLGFYEACHQLGEMRGAVADIFEDYETEVIRLYHLVLTEIAPSLAEALARHKLEREAVALFFERVRYYEHDPASRSFPMLYDFSVLEPFLKAIMQTPEVAAFFLDCLEEEDFQEESAAGALLHAAQLAENEPLWLEVAQEHAPERVEVARQLLVFLEESHQREAFHQAAAPLFRRHPEALAGWLLEKLDPDAAPQLYREVLKYRARQSRSIRHYRELRERLPAAELAAYVDALSRDWDPLFYATVLAEEKRLPELLKVVRFQVNSPELPKYIALLVEHYPAEGLELVRRQIDHLLPREQGADVYRRLAQSLALFRPLETPWPLKAGELAADLRKQYPLRPDLHQALAEEGL